MTEKETNLEAYQNYLRFGKVRYYLDLIHYAQKKQIKEIKSFMGVSFREAKFLLQVRTSPGCSLVSVQRQHVLPSSTAAWLADNLVKKGMLTREQNPKNRREVILKLTEKGEKLISKIDMRFFTPDVSQKLAQTSDDEVDQIEKALKRLCVLYNVDIKE